ncbi:unnamed protein product [Moneuplotes crassus]|uniref:Uncharacterized protein n=1 Tax=Euplotes crassus TaxID=5936 RepID=A0AAD1XS11_EUPCR|nr:unnamed protein product [Moneuplotes crassus]
MEDNNGYLKDFIECRREVRKEMQVIDHILAKYNIKSITNFCEPSLLEQQKEGTNGNPFCQPSIKRSFVREVTLEKIQNENFNKEYLQGLKFRATHNKEGSLCSHESSYECKNDNMIEAVRQAQEHQESIEISSKDSMPEEFDSSEISGRDITLRATYDNELIGVMKDLDLDLAQKKINEMKKKSYNCKKFKCKVSNLLKSKERFKFSKATQTKMHGMTNSSCKVKLKK